MFKEKGNKDRFFRDDQKRVRRISGNGNGNGNGISDDNNASVEGKPITTEDKIEGIIKAKYPEKEEITGFSFDLEKDIPESLKTNRMLADELSITFGRTITVEEIEQARQEVEREFMRENLGSIEKLANLGRRYKKIEAEYEKITQQEQAENNAYWDEASKFRVLNSRAKEDLGNKFFIRDGVQKSGLQQALNAEKYGSIWCDNCFKGFKGGVPCPVCNGTSKISMSDLKDKDRKKWDAIQNTLDEFDKGGFKDKNGKVLKTQTEVENYFKNTVDISGTFRREHKDVFRGGLQSKKWQRTSFGRTHFQEYSKEQEAFVNKFTPEEQAKFSQLANALELGKEDYENEKIKADKKLRKMAKEGKLSKVEVKKTVEELIERGLEIQKKNEAQQKRRLKKQRKLESVKSERLVSSEEQFMNEIKPLANPSAFGIDPTGKLGWNSWTKEERRAYVENNILENENDDKRRNEIENKLQELNLKFIEIKDDDSAFKKNKREIQKLEDEKEKLGIESGGSLGDKLFREALLVKMARDNKERYTHNKNDPDVLKDKNGKVLTTKEDIIDEMVNSKIMEDKKEESSYMPDRYKAHDLVTGLHSMKNQSVMDLLKDWITVTDDNIAKTTNLTRWKKELWKDDAKLQKKLLKTYGEYTLAGQLEKGSMGRMVTNPIRNMEQADSEKFNLSIKAETPEYQVLDSIRKEVEFWQGQLKSNNISPDEVMLKLEELEKNRRMNKQAKGVFSDEDEPININISQEGTIRKRHRDMKIKQRNPTPVHKVLSNIISRIVDKNTPRFKESYKGTTKLTKRQEDRRNKKKIDMEKELSNAKKKNFSKQKIQKLQNKLQNELNQLTSEMHYNNEMAEIERKNKNWFWRGKAPTSSDQRFLDPENSIYSKHFRVGFNKKGEAWFGWSNDGKEPETKRIVDNSDLADKFNASILLYLEDHDPDISNGKVVRNTAKGYKKGMNLPAFSGGAMNMQDWADRMLYKNPYNLFNFLKFIKLQNRKTRTRNEKYNIRQTLNKIDEENAKGIKKNYLAIMKEMKPKVRSNDKNKKRGVGNMTVKVKVNGKYKSIDDLDDNEMNLFAEDMAKATVDENFGNEENRDQLINGAE